MGIRFARVVFVLMVLLTASCAAVEENPGVPTVPHDPLAVLWDSPMDDLIQVLAVRNHQHGKGWAKNLIADTGDELDTSLPLNQFARFQDLKDKLGHALGEPHPAIVRDPGSPISAPDVDARVSAMIGRIDACVASGWHDTPSVAGWLTRPSTGGVPPIQEAVEKSRTLWALVKEALDM